jgi:hypothetical protein
MRLFSPVSVWNPLGKISRTCVDILRASLKKCKPLSLFTFGSHESLSESSGLPAQDDHMEFVCKAKGRLTDVPN